MATTKQNKVDTSIFIGRNLFKLDWNAVFDQWNYAIHTLKDMFTSWHLWYRKRELGHFWLCAQKQNKNCSKKLAWLSNCWRYLDGEVVEVGIKSVKWQSKYLLIVKHFQANSLKVSVKKIIIHVEELEWLEVPGHKK